MSTPEQHEHLLALRSSLEEVAHVPSWVEKLASKYSIPESIQFAINVCLEEALANVILHGYGAAPGKPVTVRFMAPYDGYCQFHIDDEAPRFNPLEQAELAALNPGEEMRIGGQGIRLLRQFATTLEYEALPNGNRLKLGFSL